MVKWFVEGLTENNSAVVSDAVLGQPQDFQPRRKSIPCEGICKGPYPLILDVVVVQVDPQKILASGEVRNLNNELHR